MEKRYQVPPEMINAFQTAMQNRFGQVYGGMAVGLEAAIRWLAERELKPSDVQKILQKTEWSGYSTAARSAVRAYLDHMFVAPEPAVPEAIKDLLWANKGDQIVGADGIDQRILEAYRRGARDATNEQMADDVMNFVDNKYGSPESK
jgi:hypothetical protein